MDELLLENSLFTNQNEYDDIVKDKEKVADIFFINYFGFLSLYKLGARGDIKRYKSEEASLYPKYIGVDNKDVSLSVKMLFDARITHGSVTARMTKLLAKIKGNMLDPKDVDNNALIEILTDSKITTAQKPSVKVRGIMQQWLDNEFAIEWVAFYLYKIARLPEYKDITKEFISMYKTGQYAQAYTNILNGARKKHTGDVPKEFQNNNPTVLATTQTDNAVDALSDKEKFMAMFKQAIDAEKDKITKGANDVPVKNNADYVEDKTPEPKQEPPAPPPIEDIEVDLVELINESIKVNNGGKVEFIKPTGKNLIYKHENVNVNLYMSTIIDIVYNGFKQAGVTPYDSNFEDIIYSLEIAVFAMLKEYKISLSVREAVSLPRSVIIQELIKDRVTGGTGENLFPENYDSYRSHTINSDNAKTIDSKYTNKVNTGEYGIKFIEHIISGDIEYDINVVRGTLQILNSLANGMAISYSKDSTTTISRVVNAFFSGTTHEISEDEMAKRFIGMIVKALFDKKTTIQKIDQLGILDFMSSVGMYDVVADTNNMINHYILTDDFYEEFKTVDGAQPYLDAGSVEISSDTVFHLRKSTVPSITVDNPFVEAMETLDGNTVNNSATFISTFNEIAQNKWITVATPNGIDLSEFNHNNIYGLYSKILSYSKYHLEYILNSYISFYSQPYNASFNRLDNLNEASKDTYLIQGLLFMENLSIEFDKTFPSLMHLDGDKLDSLVFMTMVSTHFVRNIKGVPFDAFYDQLLERMYTKLASYISKESYDGYEKFAYDEVALSRGNYTTLTKLNINRLLCELATCSPTIANKVKTEIIDKSNPRLLFGVTSHMIPRTKLEYADESKGGIFQLKITENMYEYAVDLINSGEISLADLHENIAIRMLNEGKISTEMANEYMNTLLVRVKNYNPYDNEEHHSKLRGESFDLLVMMIQKGVELDKDVFNSLIDAYAYEYMSASHEHISSMNGTSVTNNVPFVRIMTHPSLNVACNEYTDKIAEMIFDTIIRRFSIGKGDTSIWELVSVCLMRIKDKELYDKCLNITEQIYGYDIIKKGQYEYRENKLDKIYDTDVFVKMNGEAQKTMVNMMTNEINRKRKSEWMEHDGASLYVDQLMSMLLSYDKNNGDIKDLITNARLKTLMANSTVHQIDFDDMQLDLNNGVINTPKKLSKRLLLNLAKLNGFLNMADIKKEISIPRGTKAIDVVRHIKGEIKIIDGVEVKLKDVPYEPVEHTDESLKRVNAKMWKTRTDRHNDYMLIFDEEFKPTERTDNVSEFLKEFPDSKVLELSFHGTGRIAGAYICRYGFADVRGNVGIGIAGKMLGNGTYVAVNYDKSASYVTDHGTTYRAGRHDGYLFTLRCAIGTRGVHHQYAGAGRGLRVEEWCLKLPTRQIDVLSIFKCHSVTKREAHNILGEYAK